MFTVKRDERFFIIDQNNKHYEFKDYEAVLRWLSVPHHHPFYPLDWDRDREEYKGKIVAVGHNWNDSGIKYIVFDSLWRVVNLRELELDVKKFEEKREKERGIPYREIWLRAYKRRHLNIGFRSTPIPHTGRCGHCNYYRRLRTTQELRRNCWEPEFTRGKRRKKYLPNAWDDLPKARRARYSWKNQKKRKQWM